MKTSLWKRTVSMALALILLCAAPVTAMAAEKTFTLIQLAETDVELDQTAFQYTGQEIRPNVTVRVQGRLLTLDKDYTLEYADNIEIGTGKVIVTGIATASETVGYTGTVEIPFQITKEAPAYTLIQLKGTDVTIDGTSFPYTGSPIEPAITVTVEGKTLTAGKDYSLSYRNNVEVGTGTVIVTATETTGYIGTVKIPFTIAEASAPEFTLVEIKGTDVIIDGTRFTYTGEAIEPAITVTVNGTQLTAGRDYTVSYANNVEPGTASVTVKGIATASETVGYTGEVTIEFTILKAQEPETPSEPEKPTEPETPSEPEKPTEPETPSEPEKPTEPETPSEPEKPTEPSQPEEDDKEEETKPFEYKITKGSGSKWNQKSNKNLTFTVNADTDDITVIRIDGKKLNSNYYTLGKDGRVVLKNSWLEKQEIGTYRITIEFEDGNAEGKFSVIAPVDPSNPKTGDYIGLWAGAMVLSLIGAAALILLKKRSA